MEGEMKDKNIPQEDEDYIEGILDFGEVNVEILSNLVQHKQVKKFAQLEGSKNIALILGSDVNKGLPDGFNYEKHREKYGRNYIPPPPQKTYLALIVANLKDTIILMLIASAVISLILGLAVEKDFERGWIEGASILVSILVVINVQAMTDYTKAKEFRRQQMELENQQVAHVIRSGENEEISPRDLVVGDVIRFAVGDILPVDCVLIEGDDVKMDESAITGESKLINKNVIDEATINKIAEEELDIDKKIDPFLVSGTNVMSGSGLALAVAVGKYSVQGAILEAIGRSDAEKIKANKEIANKELTTKKNEGAIVDPTEQKSVEEEKIHVDEITQGGTLVQKLDDFALLIGKFGGTVAILALSIMLIKYCVAEFANDESCKNFNLETECEDNSKICVWRGGDCERTWDSGHDLNEILEFFVTAITILVVVIPEGLPLAVTLSLAVSMKRMTKDNNQVKHLDACETMGSATTVCSDKTGTLTINKMTVVKVALGSGDVEYAKKSGAPSNLGSEILEALRTDESPESCEILHILKYLTYNGILNSAPTSNVTKNTEISLAEVNAGTEYKYTGNATECALLKLSLELGMKPNEIRKHPLFKSSTGGNDWGALKIPFSSERKMMSTVVAQLDNEYVLLTKGAPSYVLEACTKVVDIGNGLTEPVSLDVVDPLYKVAEKDLTDDERKRILNKIGQFQRYGLRVIGLSYKHINNVPDRNEGIEGDMTFLGIVGIEDPLRPEIIDAIKKCRKAGVDIRMCTGDALETAVSIALQCGILQKHQTEQVNQDGISFVQPLENFAMTGPEFVERVLKVDKSKAKVHRKKFDFQTKEVRETIAYPFLLDNKGDFVIDQEVMDEIWPKLRVLARCQPIDKLTLVKGLKQSKLFEDEDRCKELKEDFGIEIFPDTQVVAVTGDGTNDAPALKKADVGFVMSITGTETAKQAADILLLDDNFLSIVKAIMWGRNVFQSISKFVQFQLTVNVAAVFLALLGAVVDNESPLKAVQMLWINLIMDSLASLALATDPPDERLLDRKPYGKRRKILSESMLFNIIGQATFQIVILLVVYFKPSIIPGNVISNDDFKNTPEADNGFGSVHWTVFFNLFVQFQLFNEINARKIQDVKRLRSEFREWNVFENFFSNHLFLAILVSTFVLQILIVQFGGAAFALSEGGISIIQWVFCVGIGACSLVWQVIAINPLLALFGSIEDDILGSPNHEHHHISHVHENWDKVRKHVSFNLGFQKTLSRSDSGFEPPIRRGSSRPNYGYDLTKQESQHLDKIIAQHAASSGILKE